LGSRAAASWKFWNPLLEKLLVHVCRAKVVEARGFGGIGLLLGRGGEENNGGDEYRART